MSDTKDPKEFLRERAFFVDDPEAGIELYDVHFTYAMEAVDMQKELDQEIINDIKELAQEAYEGYYQHSRNQNGCHTITVNADLASLAERLESVGIEL